MGKAPEVKEPVVKVEEIETSIPNETNPKIKVSLKMKFDQEKLLSLIQRDPRVLEFALAGWKIGVFQKTVRAFMIAGFGSSEELLPLLERKLIPGITNCWIKE